MKKHNKIYTLIDAKVKLPDLTKNNKTCSETVFILINQSHYRAELGAKIYGDINGEIIEFTPQSAYYTKDGWCWEYGELIPLEQVNDLTHWLEEEQNVFVLTAKEFQQVWDDAKLKHKKNIIGDFVDDYHSLKDYLYEKGINL